MKRFVGLAFGFLALFALEGRASQDEAALRFASNVSRHVLMHELAHAMIRELRLPVLGNEENMADVFATVSLSQRMRDDALGIVKDRAQSWLVEASEVRPQDYDLKGEHELDARRAYRTVCILYGTDPAEFGALVDWMDFSQRDADDCSDTAPDMVESWQRVLASHRLPEGQISEHVEVQYGEAEHTAVVRQSGLLESTAMFAREFDWPQTIILHYDSCGREAALWRRSDRTILFCDEYFNRFVRQYRAARQL